jgi:hypothetical protein
VEETAVRSTWAARKQAAHAAREEQQRKRLQENIEAAESIKADAEGWTTETSFFDSYVPAGHDMGFDGISKSVYEGTLEDAMKRMTERMSESMYRSEPRAVLVSPETYDRMKELSRETYGKGESELGHDLRVSGLDVKVYPAAPPDTLKLVHTKKRTLGPPLSLHSPYFKEEYEPLTKVPDTSKPLDTMSKDRLDAFARAVGVSRKKKP